MINHLETEYKLLVIKEQFECLSALYPNKTFIPQCNTYYDTKDMQLRQLKCAMRIREKENKFLFTLKTPDPDGHLEHECFVNENSIKVFDEPSIKKLLNELGIHDEIVMITNLKTTRAVVDTGIAELCFDINEYNGITDYEIEYELTADHNGIETFNKILAAAGLHYEENCPSKIARAMSQL